MDWRHRARDIGFESSHANMRRERSVDTSYLLGDRVRLGYYPAP